MNNSSPAPLDGVHVLSIAINLPGPLAAARLAALGARVTKVEPPAGDPMAAAVPAWYREITAEQDIVALDLSDQAGRKRLDGLLVTASVLLTSMRPAALDRLGLRAEAVRHGLVHVDIVGFDGDRSDEAGHDLTYQAAHGLLRPPAMPVVPIADLLGAERAALAALTGLRERGLGVGSPHHRIVLDHVAHDAAAAVRHGVTTPDGVLGGGLPVYGIHPTADGHVAVAAIEPHFAARLEQLMGCSGKAQAARYATATSSHWEERGRDLDIPIVAIPSAGSTRGGIR